MLSNLHGQGCHGSSLPVCRAARPKRTPANTQLSAPMGRKTRRNNDQVGRLVHSLRRLICPSGLFDVKTCQLGNRLKPNFGRQFGQPGQSACRKPTAYVTSTGRTLTPNFWCTSLSGHRQQPKQPSSLTPCNGMFLALPLRLKHYCASLNYLNSATWQLS